MLAGGSDVFAVFMIDEAGKVAAMTSAAEHMIRDRDLLSLKKGRIEGTTKSETLKLHAAITAHLHPDVIPSHSKPFTLRGAHGSFATVRVTTLHGGHCKCGKLRVGLLFVEQHVASSQSLDRLTAKEAEVAAALLTGARAPDIARERKVSKETVKSQIKAVYRKFGVKSQVAFIAALRPVPAKAEIAG